jgi:predicted  nucleic acid-binding Zn-ribbon protein
MALTAVELEELTKAIAAAHAEYGGLSNALKSLQARVDASGKVISTSTDTYDALNRASKEYKNKVSELTNQVKNNKLTEAEAQSSLKNLKSQFDATLDSMQSDDDQIKAHIESTRKNVDATSKQTVGAIKTTAAMNDLSTYTSGASKVLGSLGSSAAKLIQGYTGGQNDIAMAGTTAGVGLGLLAKAGSITGQTLSSLGQSAMGTAALLAETGPFAAGLGLLGAALTVTGEVIKFFSAGVNEVAQKVLPTLTAEIEKAFNSFNSISSSGALFTNGLDGMRDAATAVNLTLPEFANVLKENSTQLASSGLGMVQAAKQMGEVGKVMRTTGISMQLQRLGYTFKDQAELITDTMSNFAATNRLRGASEETLSRFTDDYASSLKVLSGITGEDAKKAVEKNRRAVFQADVYAALQDKGPEAMAKFTAQMAQLNNLDPSGKLANAFAQQVSGITDVTDSSTRFLMQNDKVSASLKKMSDLTLDNNVTQEDSVKGTSESLSTFREGVKELLPTLRLTAAAGRANIETLPGLNDMAGNVLAGTQYTKEAAEAAKDNVDLVKKGQGELTQATIDAANVGRQMTLLIQNSILDKKIMGNFAIAITDVTNTMLGLIRQFGGGSESASSRRSGISQTFNSTNDASSGMAAAALSQQRNINTRDLASFATMISGTPGGLDPDHDAPPDALAWLQAHPDDPRTKEFLARTGAQLARGGIVSGPTSGFPATLHGSEAVIPLPDGVSGPEFAQALQGLSRFSNATNEAAEAGSRLRDQLSNLSNDLLSSLNSKIDDLIYATQDVARYTKETSVRIM